VNLRASWVLACSSGARTHDDETSYPDYRDRCRAMATHVVLKQTTYEALKTLCRITINADGPSGSVQPPILEGPGLPCIGCYVSLYRPSE
jgi:hypothetical protein